MHIPSPPAYSKSCKLSENSIHFSQESVESVQPVQMNIYQLNIYRKDVDWSYSANELRDQNKQQVWDQQSKTLFLQFI